MPEYLGLQRVEPLLDLGLTYPDLPDTLGDIEAKAEAMVDFHKVPLTTVRATSDQPLGSLRVRLGKN